MNGTLVNSTTLVVPPGASSQAELSWTPTRPGVYELRVEVRDGSGVLVKVETYVVEVRPPPRPDLSLLNLTVSGPVVPGEPVEVEVTVVNLGDAASPPTEILVVEFPTDRVIFSGEVVPLQPGEEVVIPFEYPVPVEPGNYSLVVILDPENAVEEADEENTFEFGVSVPPAPGPPPTTEISPTETPTSPPTEAPTSPAPTETEAPTQPPTTPAESEYPVTPPVEEGGIPTAALIALSAGVGAALTYLFWKYFYHPEVPPAGACCLEWNVSEGDLLLKTVRPVLCSVSRMRGGRREEITLTALFVEEGGYLPLVAKVVNVDWINARALRVRCGGKGSVVAAEASIPVPENVRYRWEIVRGPGHLLSPTMPTSSQSLTAEGPAALYVAPAAILERKDAELKERLRARCAVIRLTVDDPEGQLKGLDSRSVEKYFVVVVVGSGIASSLIFPKGKKMTSHHADYSEVSDPISPPAYFSPSQREVPSAKEREFWEEKVKALRKRLETKSGDLKTLEKIIQERRAELMRARAELRRLEKRIREEGESPELVRKQRAMREEIKRLREDLFSAQDTALDLEREVNELKSELASSERMVQYYSERVAEERACRLSFKWENFSPIEGRILRPSSIDIESPWPEELFEAQTPDWVAYPREPVIFMASAEDVDLLKLRVEGDGGGRSADILVKDWVRFEWSAEWADGRGHESDPGKFLITKEGESVIFLAPKEEGVVEISCKMYDSKMQYPDGAAEHKVKLRVRGPGPYECVDSMLRELERCVTRPEEGGPSSSGDWKPTERLGDLERFLLNDLGSSMYCFRSSLEGCEEELFARWLSDLLWNIGNLILAFTGVGAALGEAIEVLGSVEKMGRFALKARDAFSIMSSAAGVFSAATPFLPEMRPDLASAEKRLGREAARSYLDWLEFLKEGEKFEKSKSEPPHWVRGVGQIPGPGIYHLLRKSSAALTGCKMAARQIWDSYARSVGETARLASEALEKDDPRCFQLQPFANHLALLIRLICPPEEKLRELEAIIQRAKESNEELASTLALLERTVSDSLSGCLSWGLWGGGQPSATPEGRPPLVPLLRRMYRNTLIELQSYKTGLEYEYGWMKGAWGVD